jgi:uncharacterized membrane protein YvlD (DUF360 family)
MRLFHLSLFHLVLSALCFATASFIDSDTLRFQGLGFMSFFVVIWYKAQEKL